MVTSSHDGGIQVRLEHVNPTSIAGLRAALAGFDDESIATLLAIPVESVRPTLRLAASKLASALG